MQLLHTIKELRTWRKDKGFIALVPTMGNLHEGHLQLVNEAKKLTDIVVVSIFVNPIQFGQGEDFDSYPRTLEQDTNQLIESGASIVFAPDTQEIYPVPQTVFVEPSAIQNDLCGASRSGHFRGAATVVNKLFNIVQPDIACFGKKDYQQLFIIQEMVTNFNIPVQIVAVETSRNQDGLALSSRNGYLSESERAQAPQLYQKLTVLKQAILNGEKDFLAPLEKAKQQLNQQGWNVEYLEIRNALNLQPATLKDKHLIILAAARLGKTRLIDNIEVFL